MVLVAKRARRLPNQCCSCGGFCGGGYTDKAGRHHFCRNVAHLSVTNCASDAKPNIKLLLSASKKWAEYMEMRTDKFRWSQPERRLYEAITARIKK